MNHNISSKAWKAKNTEAYAQWATANQDKRKTSYAAWKFNNPEAYKNRGKKFELAHPGYGNRKSKAWAKAHPERRHAMTTAALRRRQERIAGRKCPKICDICKAEARKICFDHCHKSKEFRGWLCHNCNVVLGLVKDSPKILHKLAQYLDKHSKKAKVKIGKG